MRHFLFAASNAPLVKAQFHVCVRLTLAVAALLVICIPAGCARASTPTEYEIEAAYLYNFGLFVQWPTAFKTDTAFTICVLGEDPFGKALDRALAGQSIGSQSAIARRISNLQEASGCRILFIGSSEQAHLGQLLSSLGTLSVLTVSDMPEFVKRGGIIQFVLVDNRVHFEINLAAASRAGLALSSQLVKLAVTVERNVPLQE
jgi:hypothetical protein